MEFRILSFSSFLDVNILNDNIDINVVFSNGDVFFATLITIENIKQLMEEESFFWIDTMLIVSSLEKRSEEHTSELQSRPHLVCRLLLEKKKIKKKNQTTII